MTVTARRAMRGILAGAVSAGIVVALAACSSSGAGDSGSGTPAPEATPTPVAFGDPYGTLETPTVKVSGIAGPGLIPVQVAIDQTAAKYGLTIEFVPATDSGAVTTSVINGDIQFGNASYFGFIGAVNQGLPLEVVAEGWESTEKVAYLMARAGSGITDARRPHRQDRQRHLTASSHAIKLHDQMLQQGLDPDKVNWVSLPYSQVADAFAQGTLDASSAVGPTLAAVKAAGATIVYDYGGQPYTGMAESGFISSDAFTSKNPNTTVAFQCAIFAAQDLINNDHDLYVTTFQTFLKAPEAAAKGDVPNTFLTTNRIDQLNRNIEVYKASGLYEGGDFDFADHTIRHRRTADRVTTPAGPRQTRRRRYVGALWRGLAGVAGLVIILEIVSRSGLLKTIYLPPFDRRAVAHAPALGRSGVPRERRPDDPHLSAQPRHRGGDRDPARDRVRPAEPRLSCGPRADRAHPPPSRRSPSSRSCSSRSAAASA